MEKLIFQAKCWKARLVTTEKDFIRIPSKYRDVVFVVPVKIAWETPITDFLGIVY
jgi:tetraacyldisaccharide-1-P 4'-kinase